MSDIGPSWSSCLDETFLVELFWRKPEACSTTRGFQRAPGENALLQLNASERSLVLRNGVDKQENK